MNPNQRRLLSGCGLVSGGREVILAHLPLSWHGGCVYAGIRDSHHDEVVGRDRPYEAVRVVWNTSVGVPHAILLQAFWECHDPTGMARAYTAQ